MLTRSPCRLRAVVAARPGLTSWPPASLGTCTTLWAADLVVPVLQSGNLRPREALGSVCVGGTQSCVTRGPEATPRVDRVQWASRFPSPFPEGGVLLQARPSVRGGGARAHPWEVASRSPLASEHLTSPTRVPEVLSRLAVPEETQPDGSLPGACAALTRPQGAQPRSPGDRDALLRGPASVGAAHLRLGAGRRAWGHQHAPGALAPGPTFLPATPSHGAWGRGLRKERGLGSCPDFPVSPAEAQQNSRSWRLRPPSGFAVLLSPRTSHPCFGRACVPSAAGARGRASGPVLSLRGLGVHGCSVLG